LKWRKRQGSNLQVPKDHGFPGRCHTVRRRFLNWRRRRVTIPQTACTVTDFRGQAPLHTGVNFSIKLEERMGHDPTNDFSRHWRSKPGPAPYWGQPLHKNFGGERGIRTPGAFTPNGFQDRLLKPLGHLALIFGGRDRARTCKRFTATV
jgi:hypothetical protein